MKYAVIVPIVVALAFFTACSSDSDSPSATPAETGHFTVRLTDAPVAYEAINITFTQLDINHDDGWISILLDSAVTVDLLEWNNGKSIVLGEGDLNPGTVSEVRLIIDRASIVVNGVEHPMDIPSGSSSGLKIKTSIGIEAGISYTLILDFDAQNSIVTQGPPSNPKGYKLNPVIRAVSETATGSISGIVANPEHYAVVSAEDSTGTAIASTVADNTTGAFLLGYLPAGTYNVNMIDTLGSIAGIDGVVVTVGANTDIGTWTLQ